MLNFPGPTVKWYYDPGGKGKWEVFVRDIIFQLGGISQSIVWHKNFGGIGI
jgi:hypothetical protein